MLWSSRFISFLVCIFFVRQFPADFAEVLIRSVVKILNCDFADLPKDILKHYFVTSWTTSDNFHHYRKCVRDQAGPLRNGSIPDHMIDGCVHHIYPQCKSRPIRSVKTIRMTALQMEHLLELDPSIRILYYIRDPRGLLNSRWSIFGRKDVEFTVRNLCGKIREDMIHSQILLKRFTSQFHLLRYEDLVLNTTKFAEDVYTLIKHVAPPPVLQYMYDSSHADAADGVMGTKRKNSTETAIKWMKKLPADVLHIFDKHCSDIYEGFDYPRSVHVTA